MSHDDRINILENKYNQFNSKVKEIINDVNIVNSKLTKVEEYGPKLDTFIKSFTENNLNNKQIPNVIF